MKIYAGIFQDGLEIKIAFLKKSGKKLQIQKIISVPSSEKHFVYNTSNLSSNVDEENFDIEEIREGAKSQTQLNQIIGHYPLENIKFTPVITEPQISYLVYNPETSKKYSEIKNDLKKLWKETNNLDLPLNKIDFIEYKNNSFISSVVQEDIPILSELTDLASYCDAKSLDILSLRSGDITLINYVFRFYHPGKDETFLIIYIGVDSVRLIFIKDEKVIHINRYLSLNFERQGLVGFISSKIVLEMEYAGITEISNILLTGEINDELISSFRQSFPFTIVDALNLNIFDTNHLDEKDKGLIQSYSLPLIAVLDELYPYHNVRKNLEVHSKRLSKISVIKRIDFISIFLFLVLIFLIWFSINRYLERSKQLENLIEQTSKVEKIITSSPDEIRKIDSLSKKFEILNSYHNKTEQLLKDRVWWTDQLMTINSFNPRKNKMWLTTITVDEKNNSQIIIRGLTLDRSKIPDFMEVLKDAELKNIHLYEIRGKKIFQFELLSRMDIR